MLQAFQALANNLPPSTPLTAAQLPTPYYKSVDEVPPLTMSEINMLLPTCTCLVTLARTSLIEKFLQARRHYTLNSQGEKVYTYASRGEVLTQVVKLTRSCCREHFKCGLLTQHPVEDLV